MKKILLTIALALSIGCNPTEQVNSTSGGKSLWSVWTADSGDYIFDFRNAVFNESLVMEVAVGGYLCEMDIIFTGSETSGNAIITLDSCDVFNGAYSYTKSGSVLTICDDEGCFNYH